uniref:NAD(P)-dependent oxidoreductase n=1 Tax=Fundidesulfovibrio putealis TaxID=270496 RepID=A0A7C4AGZ5_9BACT
MKLSVGFAGMGIMGKPMALNLAKAGYAVTVYNRTRPLPETIPGLAVADTPRALAEANDAVFLMVTNPEASDALLWGANGMGPALGEGKLVVNMSTVPPAYAAQAAQRVGETGAVYVDAPVSGSKPAAEAGSLVILAGGPADAVKTLEPLLLAMGRKVVHCGDAPGGSMMKMSVNLLLASMMEGLAEMLVFGRAGGLDVGAMLEVALGGPLACDLFRIKEHMLREGSFPAQFPLKHMAKDLKYVTDTASDMKCPAPAAYSNLQLYNQGMSKGLGELDFSAVIKVLEGMI